MSRKAAPKSPAKAPAKSKAKSKAKAAPRAKRGEAATADGEAAAVAAFMAALAHPLRREIDAVRALLVGCDPSIREAIKWNAPSYRTREFFATFHLRARDRVQLVFHRGARTKASAARLEIEDPAGLAKWLATDRCLVDLGRGAELAARRDALVAFVRQWLAHLEP